MPPCSHRLAVFPTCCPRNSSELHGQCLQAVTAVAHDRLFGSIDGVSAERSAKGIKAVADMCVLGDLPSEVRVELLADLHHLLAREAAGGEVGDHGEVVVLSTR
jgi:hypothetical protein